MWAPASTWASDVALDPAEVARPHLLGEELAAGRVDPLADDHERPVVADDDLAGRRADDGLGHGRLRAASRSGSGPRFGVAGLLGRGGVKAAGRPPGAMSRSGGYAASSRAASAVGLGRQVVAAGRLHPPPLGHVGVRRPRAPARAAAWSIATWKRACEHDLAARPAPWPAMTWAGMSRHQMTVSVSASQAVLRSSSVSAGSVVIGRVGRLRREGRDRRLELAEPGRPVLEREAEPVGRGRGPPPASPGRRSATGRRRAGSCRSRSAGARGAGRARARR